MLMKGGDGIGASDARPGAFNRRTMLSDLSIIEMLECS